MNQAARQEDTKAERLASQWPKPHLCRATRSKSSASVWTYITQEQWARLPLVGPLIDAWATHEMRNCDVCDSTLMVATAIRDPRAEMTPYEAVESAYQDTTDNLRMALREKWLDDAKQLEAKLEALSKALDVLMGADDE